MIKNKTTIYIFLIFLSFNVKAQNKIFNVIDSITNLPISKASVLSKISKDGSITNNDGNVKINTSHINDTLVISCVGYETKKIDLINFGKADLDTIKMVPSILLLNEVKINWIDLKKKFADLLKNYGKFYFTSPILYNCTYKENVKINDSLARLIQVQLKWYDKSYGLDFSQQFDVQNKISLINIDYSKILNLNNAVYKAQSYIENPDLFKLLHLNFYPLFINEANQINIKSIDNYQYFNRVTFSSPIIEHDSTVMFIKDGVIDFDNITGAIIGLDFNNVYNRQIKILKSVKEPQIDYTSEVKSQHIKLTFKKYNKEKWVISSFKSDIVVELKIPTKSYNSTDKISQEFLITNIEENVKIPKKEQIDLKKPFYLNFPTNKNLDTKILLTKEEEDFIKKKN
nr:carboxypeptidase-like regulatory domain-containing protein [Pseudopedobacter sp.]